MGTKIRNFLSGWWFLALIVTSQILVLIFAPNEMTLGSGIKPVYLHVSLTWVGMILFLIAGVLGVLVLISGSPKLAVWFRSIFYAAVLFYSGGFLISLYASFVNWGGIPFQEPRIRNAINVVVVGIAAWAFLDMVPNLRLKGVSGIFPILFILFARGSDRMVLHPEDPVSSAPFAIRNAFIFMFVLAMFLAGWVLIQIYERANHKTVETQIKVSQGGSEKLQNS